MGISLAFHRNLVTTEAFSSVTYLPICIESSKIVVQRLLICAYIFTFLTEIAITLISLVCFLFL